MIKDRIYNQIKVLSENNILNITGEMSLLGEDCILDSMKLVELCLFLEDLASEFSFEFDWTSDAAMSKSKSMFRTVDALIDEFIAQMECER